MIARPLVWLLTMTLTLGAAPLAVSQTLDPGRQWGQWRGPLATGEAPHAQPPVEWGAEKNVRWKVKLPGSGTSTPVVWGDSIFLTTAIPVARPADEAATEAPADALTQQPTAQQPPAQQPAAQPPRRGDQPPEGRRPGAGGAGRQPGGFGPPGGGFGRPSRPTQPYQFVVLCLDRQTGETRWSHVAREETPHEGHHQDHGYASHSAATDGTCVVAYFGSRGLYCYEPDGKLRWSKDLGKMQTRNGFGEGSSPVLFGDTIVVNWDHEGSDDFIAAFDKKSGQELWRQPRSEPTSWGTPLVVVHDGKPQVVTPGTENVRSYDLATGRQIWESSGLTTNSIPSPVAAAGVVYLTSGYRGSALVAVRLGYEGNLAGGEAIAWSHDRNTPYVPSPLLVNDRLYFFASNNAILTCFHATKGEAVFGPERIEGLSGVYASPVAADGRVYLVGRNGTTVVIRQADRFEVLATNELGERVDASPALVGDQLLLRGHEHLYSFGVGR